MPPLDAYDTALLGILQNEGNIKSFLEVVFGFLYRRTDFYRILESKEGKLGFPPGVSGKLAQQAFQKYDVLAAADREQSDTQNQTKQAKADEIVHQKPDPSHQSDKKKVVSEPEPVKLPESVVQAGIKESETHEPDKQGDDSELAKAQKLFQSNPDSYNGAIRENYSWSQTITDIDIKINVPKYVQKGKDVKVEIQKQALKAHFKDQDNEWKEVLDGKLCWPIYREESMWSLVPSECIHVNLEKVQERWWEAALKDEPRLNVRKMDPSRPMSDLDDEAQAKIHEMMWNDQQKKMGLPTSDQLKMQNTLKNAWNREGSPFKGQPFDPSVLNVPGNQLM